MPAYAKANDGTDSLLRTRGKGVISSAMIGVEGKTRPDEGERRRLPLRDCRRVESHGKGVAELRSSVIRINSKNASPARSRDNWETRTKRKMSWVVGRKGSTRPRTGTGGAKPEGSNKWVAVCYRVM